MTGDDRLAAALARLAEADVAELLADVRRDAAALARRRLVDAYADALVRAAAATLHETASAGCSGSHPPTSTPVAAAAPATPTGDERGCYVYAVLAGDGAGAAPHEPGIQPGGLLDVVTGGGLSAVVSDVDVTVMRAAGTTADLSEDGWLAQAVRAHERVVLAAFRSAPTVPMRFGVVYPDRDAVARMLADHAATIRAELDRLAGTAEWNVKVVAHVPSVKAALAHDGDDDPRTNVEPASGHGTAFLLQQRGLRRIDQRVDAFVAARVDALSTALRAAAREAVALPASGTPPDLRTVMATAYLVDKADEDRFAAAVDGFVADNAESGLRVSLDGPFPPYHFTALRLEAGHG